MRTRVFVLAIGLAGVVMGCKPIQRMLNELPTASVAVPTQTVSRATLAGASVYLQGTGDDPDGDSLSYLWFPYDAPLSSNVLIYNYTSATAYFTPDGPEDDGAYVFLFQVNDGLEDSKPVTVTVTVNP